MSPRGTKIAEGFSARLLEHIYERSLMDYIVNRDYEGEITGVGSVLNIQTLGKLQEKNYNGSNLTADDLTESNARLVIDQWKSFYWKEKTINKFLSYIKNPENTVIAQAANERMKNMDEFVLGFYGDVAAGNRVGTDVSSGTISITANTGAFTISGATPVTSAWVGRGIKAVGHSKWYRVKSVASNATGVIENDSDDEASGYDGGTINNAAYVVEAVDKVKIIPSTLRYYVGQLKLKLDQAEVPDTDRWLVVPPEMEEMITRAGNIQLAVPESYDELVKRGFITELLGFRVFRSTRLTGNNSDGYRILAGHRNWLTFAEKVLEARMEEDLIGNFGVAYKDLFVYGAKVADVRRPFAAELFAYFAES